MATRKRHTPQQVVRKLTQADRMRAEGKEIADVCRELQVSEQTYYRWRNQFGGLKADDVKRLKELERENAVSCWWSDNPTPSKGLAAPSVRRDVLPLGQVGRAKPGPAWCRRE